MLICDVCKKKTEMFNTDLCSDSDVYYFLSSGRETLQFHFKIGSKDINFVCSECEKFLREHADIFNKKFENKRKELIKDFGEKLLKKLGYNE